MKTADTFKHLKNKISNNIDNISKSEDIYIAISCLLYNKLLDSLNNDNLWFQNNVNYKKIIQRLPYNGKSLNLHQRYIEQCEDEFDNTYIEKVSAKTNNENLINKMISNSKDELATETAVLMFLVQKGNIVMVNRIAKIRDIDIVRLKSIIMSKATNKHFRDEMDLRNQVIDAIKSYNFHLVLKLSLEIKDKKPLDLTDIIDPDDIPLSVLSRLCETFDLRMKTDNISARKLEIIQQN